MADESIIALRRPGFPKENVTADGYRAEIEYVGDFDTLYSAPVIGQPWGDYEGYVTAANIEPIEKTTYGILLVVVERKFDASDYPEEETGTLKETNYEIDWVDVQRSLYEHKLFRVGGGGVYELTNEDVANLNNWEKMPDPKYKKDFIFATNPETWSGGSEGTATLSANAQMLAKGMLQGLEYWVDKAPVARRQETYVGGPPPATTAGLKEALPGGFPNPPAGYEWLRSADRSTMRGDGNKWNRDSEWIGAIKVLIDRNSIYYA